MEFVLTLALILTFSPGEKEQPLCIPGFADDYRTNPAVRPLGKRKLTPQHSTVYKGKRK